jgi:Tfp pilus assembly protein PilV
MRRASKRAFALYEVMLGLAIFAMGVVALGRAVSNCISATSLRADDARVRQVLANRMAEVQTAPGQPDTSRETKVDTGYGIVQLVQKAQPIEMKENRAVVPGIVRVTLMANWSRGGAAQSKQIAFYVYRAR